MKSLCLDLFDAGLEVLHYAFVFMVAVFTAPFWLPVLLVGVIAKAFRVR